MNAANPSANPSAKPSANPPQPESAGEPPESQPKPGIWGATVETAKEFSNDDGMTQAAALAFYVGLSIAPMLTIAVWALQQIPGTKAKDQILHVAEQVLGPQAAAPIAQLIDPASTQAQAGMTVTGLLSILFLAVSASGVFGQLQSSLNIMWNVKADPKAGGILSLIRKRLFSFGMLLTLLFLMLTSTLLSFAIEAAVNVFGGEASLIARGVNLAITFVVATGIFTLLFTYLPDVRVPWKDTLFGAALTSLLFIAGRFALAYYLGRGSYETSYGAAVGSFVALLVWVYYTSIIIFIGTEATQVYARRRGHEPRAEEHAVKVERVERTIDPAASSTASS
jgi:membrane protein